MGYFGANPRKIVRSIRRCTFAIQQVLAGLPDVGQDGHADDEEGIHAGDRGA